ncbi:hypothetical protein BX600DRAFT_435985 [Xylariales sp. PMI_506]|nr:hypothetical protein BX600DRAFT_435985 [Xylariales sp. PMI_506]
MQVQRCGGLGMSSSTNRLAPTSSPLSLQGRRSFAELNALDVNKHQSGDDHPIHWKGRIRGMWCEAPSLFGLSARSQHLIPLGLHFGVTPEPAQGYTNPDSKATHAFPRAGGGGVRLCVCSVARDKYERERSKPPDLAWRWRGLGERRFDIDSANFFPSLAL